MSLINQVLTDLDARRPGSEAGGLPAGVRPVPPRQLQRDRPLLPWLAVLAGLVLAIAVGWRLWPAPVVHLPPPPVAVAAPAGTLPSAATAATDLAAPSPDSPVPPPTASSARSTPGAPPADARVAAPSPAVPFAHAVPAQPEPARPMASEPDLRLAQQLRSTLQPTRPAAPSVPAAAVDASLARVDKVERQADPAARARERYRKALNDAAQGRQAAALAGLSEALALDPTAGEVRQTLLRLLFDQGDFVAAETVLADGLALDPARSDWALLLSRLQLEHGDLAAASTLLATTLARTPDNAELAGALGAVLHKQQRYPEAAQRYRQATARDPNNGRHWLGLALALEAVGATADARPAFQRALDSGTLSADLASYARGRLR